MAGEGVAGQDGVWLPTYPILTARTSLRPHRMADLDDLVVFHSDPEVTRYIPWPVRDRAATAVALEAKLPRDRAAEVGDWIILAVESRETGRVVGEVLLKRGEAGAAEIGYAFGTAVQGRGLAHEAVSAIIEIAVSRFGVRRLEAVVDVRNARSIRLPARLRFTSTGEAVAGGPDEQLVRYVAGSARVGGVDGERGA